MNFGLTYLDENGTMRTMPIPSEDANLSSTAATATLEAVSTSGRFFMCKVVELSVMEREYKLESSKCVKLETEA